MNNVAKIFDLYNCLLSHEMVTAQYLSKRMGVSLRSVYRYVSLLDPIIPIEVVHGKYGGYRLMESHTISKNCFTEEEFRTLISIIDSIDSADPQITESIRNKLFATHKEKYESYAVMSNSLIIDANSWGSAGTSREKLRLVQKSLDKRLCLKIKYQDRNGDLKERNIQPHILILKQGFWYVYAYCQLRQDFRLFKLCRILSATTETTHFERRPIDKKQLPFDVWFKSLDTVTIDFTLTPLIKPDVEEWLGVENVFTHENGVITASANLPDDKEVYSKIMTFGKDLTVIAPQSVKEKLHKMATELAEKYK